MKCCCAVFPEDCLCIWDQAGVKPNVRTYTALITALGNAKQWSRALELLRSLKADTSSGRIEPNAYTYSALLKTMGEHGQWQLAEQVQINVTGIRNCSKLGC